MEYFYYIINEAAFVAMNVDKKGSLFKVVKAKSIEFVLH